MITWEGVIEEVNGEEITARLADPDGIEYMAEFDFALVDESQRHLVEPGAIFTINSEKQRIEMRDLGVYTAEEIERAKKWARKQVRHWMTQMEK